MAWTIEERQAYFRRRYRQRRYWAIDYLGGKCVDCGEDDPDDLEFDHSDPELRPVIQISTVVRAWSIPRLAKTLRQQKIELRCTACHAEKSAREREKMYFA